MKVWLFCIAATLVAAMGFAAQESRQTWSGQVTDTVCSKHPTPDSAGARGVAARKQCTLTCVKNHADFALLIDGKLYEISNAKDLRPLLEKHAGEDVKITGVATGTTITVSRIETP